MLLTTLLQEMMGDHTEFEQLTLMLPVDTATEVRDLAYQMGVPVPRLLAELVRGSVAEARTEWRMLMVERTVPGEPADAPVFSLELPPRVK